MTVIENAGPGQLGQRVVGSKPIPVRGMGSRVIGNVIPDAVFVTSGTGNIGRATSKTLKDTSTDAFETQLNVSAIDEPIRVILGRCRVGAHIPRVLASSSSLVVICLWGRGECDAVESITMGGSALPSGSSVTHYTGTQVQTVNATLVSAFAGIGVTWTNPLLGFCYSVVTLPPRNSGGVQIDLADFHAVVRGLKCYDPRDGGQVYATPSTWLYTNCPALLTARVLTDATLGLGMTPTSAFWSDVTTVANANYTALSGGEKKRVLNLCMENQQPAESWVKTLAQYMGALVVPEGSIFRFIADGTASSIATITEANMVEGSFSWQKRDIRKRPNVVYVRFTEPQATGDWIPSIAPIGVDVPSVPSGEQLRGQIVEMPGVTSYSQANRESIERRNHLYLEDLEMSFTLFDEGLELQLGDVITVSYGALFTSKLMRIMGINTADVGLWQINCAEYDPASYSTVVATSPTYTDTGLASQNSPPTVTGLALKEIVESPGPGGTPRSSIACTWDSLSATYPFLTGYRVYVMDDSGTLVDEGEPLGNSWTSRPLPAPQRYTVYVKSKSSIATSETYDSDTITLSGSTTSLTLISTSPVLRAGATFTNYDYYTLYPGDPYLRVALAESTTFDDQFTTDTIADATDSVLTHLRGVGSYRATTNVKTATVDLGISRSFTAAVVGASGAELYASTFPALGFETAEAPGGPWTFTLGTVCSVIGRYIRLVIFQRDELPILTLPDGGDTLGPPVYSYPIIQQDLAGASLQFFGPTIEETDVVTTSASGPVTVTLSGHYAALRDLQVTALQSAGTAVATFDNVTLSLVADNTFEVNATVAGARVAVPVRWNFKGAA